MTTKNIFSTLVLFLFASASFASDIIDGWDPSLPVTQEDTSAQIAGKVSDNFLFEDEGNYVGGEASNYRLVDYYTFEDDQGAVTYKARVQYHATMTLDWGRSETTRACESIVTVDPQNVITVGALECADLP